MRCVNALSLCLMLHLCGSVDDASAQSPAAQSNDERAAQETALTIQRIQQEVAAIRGLPFKQPVQSATQSPEEFRRRLDERVATMLPPVIAKHYGQIVRKLGLYRGPLIGDVGDLMKMVLTSQAAAYYEPTENAFFVLMQQASDTMQGVLYAHELYHGLQHQHFDLEKYLGAGGAESDPNRDALLARQSVIEGEATYMMTLWLMQQTLGKIPEREILSAAIGAQSRVDMDDLQAMVKQPGAAEPGSDQLQSSIEAMQKIPPYILQTMGGAYLKGLAFIFAVHEGGWPQVARLYEERPPVSSEQILHPEKWLADERPDEFELAKVTGDRRLRDWQLLQENVLGEFQWRIVFKEYGLRAEAESVAAGWNGDRYAVLKRKDSDALLLLLRTSWDTAADATEFAAAYRRLLMTKYEQAPEPTRVLQQGKEVVIVEGGSEAQIDELVRLTARAKRSAAPARKP